MTIHTECTEKRNFSYTRFLEAVIMVLLLATSFALSIPTLNLRSTDNYVILAGSTVTGLSPFNITGDVGLSPAAGSYITGFDGSNVTGTLYVVDASGPAGSVINATLLTTAKGDLTTAYTDAANRTPVPTGTYLNPGAGNIGGLNLTAGLYKFTGAAGITGSDLTLTGNATDVWIFQIGSSLNLGSGISIILAGGAQAANIFWQVGTSATLGTYSTFKGTILADQSISLGTGASMEGRALAFTGAVTMSSGVTTSKAVLSNNAPIFSVNPGQLAFGNVNNGSSKRDSVTVTNTGTADLNIISITSSNTRYTFTPTSGTITPGSTRKFYITFSPLTNSSQTGKIYFNHNAANLLDSISVSGTGISPVFSVTPAVLNFGNVRNDLIKLDSVTVSNTGTANLVISSVTSSNLRFTVTPTTGTITPGSSLKYYVTFAPLVDGLQNGKIYFNHNGTNAKDSINVSGTGVSPLFSATPLILNFGNVRNDLTKLDSVTVSNTGTANLVISTVTSSNFRFIITPTTGTITPGSSLKFYFTFAPLVDGLQSGYIYFNHNAKLPKDSIRISGTGVSPVFSASFNNLNFGNVRSGLSKRDSASVTNTGTTDLIITNVTSSNSLFTVTPTTGIITPGSTKKFYVTFAPLVDGLQSGRLFFYHNAKNLKDSINVTGTGVSPKFAVTPRNLNFGNVITGTTKIDSVTVSNAGTADLVISSFTSSSAYFVINAINAVIAPGTSQTFYIMFTPLYSEFLDGYIRFTFNATNLSDSIYTTGTGVGNPVFPKFTVNPTSLSFGSVNSGTIKQDTLVVTNTGTANLIINGVSSNNVFYKINPAIGTIIPGTSRKFFVVFAPLKPGAQVGYVYFYHNASNGKDSVYVNGIGVGENLGPKFTVKYDLDFGTVFLGSTKQKSVEVTNTGTSDLIISNVFSTNTQYTITPVLGRLTPGASLEFFITFAPTFVGRVDAKVIFTHNDGIDTINVTGVGLNNLEVITIEDARKLPIGTEFVIEGIVTRALGNYTRIQDETAGLTIIQHIGLFYNDLENYDIQMGDKIRVQGRISEVGFLKVIDGVDLTGYQRLSRLNTLPTPVKVSLSELVSNGEKYESRLITVERMTVAGGNDIVFMEAKSYQTKDQSDNTNLVEIRIGDEMDTEMDGMTFLETPVKFVGVLSQSSMSDPLTGYQLTPVLPTDLSIQTGIFDSENQISLSDNYPNPFNSSTSIQYNLENADFVSLKVFNVLGKEVATLVNSVQEAGSYNVTFDVDHNNLYIENGVYFYTMTVGKFVSAKQMIFVK